MVARLATLATTRGPLLAIRSGDVVRSMGLANRTPAVCSVLKGAKFQQMAGLELVESRGPAASTTTTCYYNKKLGTVPRYLSTPAPPDHSRQGGDKRTNEPPRRKALGAAASESATLPSADLCLVSCVAKKLPGSAPAKDLYTSDLFRKMRILVEAQGWPWFILSAKYGIVDPERVIEPYEKTLKTMRVAERRDWAAGCLGALGPHLAGVQSVVFLAGATYQEFLAPALRDRGFEVHDSNGRAAHRQTASLARPRHPVSQEPTADRVADTVRFYELLSDLAASLGGCRRLAECSGRMDWPQRGVYFFFEPGESRSLSGTGNRVVRIGTHALTNGSRSTLWQRLSQHRGNARGDGGNHRGSIFRLLVGLALARRGDCPLPPSWGVGADPGKAAQRLGLASRAVVKDAEAGLERRVSAYLGQMPFLWLDVPDAPGPQSARGRIERNAIALLSHASHARAPAADRPSATWLGAHSDRPRVRRSGLWNNNHVDEVGDAAFLSEMTELVEAHMR